MNVKWKCVCDRHISSGLYSHWNVLYFHMYNVISSSFDFSTIQCNQEKEKEKGREQKSGNNKTIWMNHNVIWFNWQFHYLLLTSNISPFDMFLSFYSSLSYSSFIQQHSHFYIFHVHFKQYWQVNIYLC